MASKKAKTNHPAQVDDQVVATETSATETSAPDDAGTGSKLRTSTKAKAAATPDAKKPKKAPGTPKAEKAASKSKKAAPQDKKLSALDAAAKVLQESGQPMNCQEMIAAMAAKAYWTSPAGKTPAATLYAAMTREIKTKGSQARFHKTARGHFVYQSPPKRPNPLFLPNMNPRTLQPGETMSAPSFANETMTPSVTTLDRFRQRPWPRQLVGPAATQPGDHPRQGLPRRQHQPTDPLQPAPCRLRPTHPL